MDVLPFLGVLVAVAAYAALQWGRERPAPRAASAPPAPGPSAAARERAERAVEAWVAGADRVARLLAEDRWVARSELRALLAEVASNLPPRPSPALLDPGTAARLEGAARLLDEAEPRRRARNAAWRERVLGAEAARIEAATGVRPTGAQVRAAITEEDATLVVAPAGGGKTAALVARAAWLARRRGVPESDILVLAFNRDAAREAGERLGGIGLGGVRASTFHAFGLDVLRVARGRRPVVSKLATDPRSRRLFLERSLLDAIREDARLRASLVAWFSRHLHPPVPAGLPPHEAAARVRTYERRMLDGTLVRSHEEVLVGNWLLLHGLEVRYEVPYPHDTGDRPYTPDFYLPGHDVWIEHFGVDEDGRTAPWIDGDAYRAQMEWKRSVHERHGTRLVETYSWQVRRGLLDRHLRTSLRALGVPLRRVPPERFRRLLEEAAPLPLTGLLDRFLQLQRASGCTLEAVRERAREAGSDRDRVFIEIFEEVERRYRERLESEGRIDFHAMLSEAADAVAAGAPVALPAHLLVDEAQDLSGARLRLVAALRRRRPEMRIFAVGDDWQSIYRFAGADVSLLSGLGERLDAALERVDLDRSFRLRADVHEVSARFVTRNPHQLAKPAVRARSPGDDRAGVVVVLHPGGDGDEDGRTRTVAEAMEAALADLRARGGRGGELLVLARYRQDRGRAEAAWRRVAAAARSGWEARFSTVHAAKGLEADAVMVVGARSGVLGIPCGIEDDPVLRHLLAEEGDFPHAEERRVFYVALTRSRGPVYLLGPETDPSPFVLELLDGDGRVELLGAPSRPLPCPRCGGSTLLPRRNRGGRWEWRCGQAPVCAGRLPACSACAGEGPPGALLPLAEGAGAEGGWRCSRCGERTPPCPRCGGLMVRRTNKATGEPFWGCSRWRPDGGCRGSRPLGGR